MKKKLFICFICVSACFLVKGQDLNIEQTLSYINMQLNKKENKPYQSVHNPNVVYNIYVDIWDLTYSYDIRIEQGILLITKTHSCKYFSNAERRNILFTPAIEKLSVPVNMLDYGYDYNSENQNVLCNKQDKNDNPFYFKLHTKDESSNPVTRTINKFYTSGNEEKSTERLPTVNFEYSNNNLVCEKIRNAFTHLLYLVSKDSSYNVVNIPLENDPFAKSKSKQTINSGNISTTNSSSVPMTKTGGVYEIPAILNGVLKLNFIFDAGASDVSISPDVALTLIRTRTVNDASFLGTETYRFADGSTAKSKVFLLNEIQIGNKKVYNVRVSISSSMNAPLLLGQSVLNKFGKVTIDYKNGVIIFQN